MENEIITAPAAQVTQGKLKLFATSLKVGTLLQENFYSIERLNPKKPDGFDSQRLYEKARAKKLANYILDGQEKQDAFLPASVFSSHGGSHRSRQGHKHHILPFEGRRTVQRCGWTTPPRRTA